MKKLAIFVLIIGVSICFSGCGANLENRVCENLSEVYYRLFEAESGSYYVSFSCGKREDNFEYDGVSNKKLDFGIIRLVLKKAVNATKLTYNLNVDGKNIAGNLEQNPFDGSFMADVENCYPDNAQISFECNAETVQLINASKDFHIGYNDAIGIATNSLKDVLEKYNSSAGLKAECYLKIIDNKKNGYEDYFWYFNIVGIDKKAYSVIIDANTGEVLAKRV